MLSLFKKSVKRLGVNPSVLGNLQSSIKSSIASELGMFGDKVAEAVPSFLPTASENVIKNNHNASIVLGRDRPASRMSGYGGKGDTQCASIDLVAGRQGADVKAFNPEGEPVSVDPDFRKDAARIYISQKTDIDKNFGLAHGSVGRQTAKSAIGLKADGIRILGREGIKLVTTMDKKNSQGGDIQTVAGIDIIAGNDSSDLQPMVKGTNTVEALEKLTMHVAKLNGIVARMLEIQAEFNSALNGHYHFSPFFASPTTPPDPATMAKGAKTLVNHLTKTKISLTMNKAALGTYRINYLTQVGEKYINSRFNKVN